MHPDRIARPKTLFALSYAYLAIPVLLFLLGWIKPVFAVPLSALIVYACVASTRNAKAAQTRFFEKPWKALLILAVLLIWVLSSGIGGLAWQNRWDHMYRNAIFRDLVSYPWPVVRVSGEETLLCYYIGFWLPSAAVGKLFGHSIGYWSQIVWAFFGVALAFGLISEYLKKVSYRALMIFVFFSGLDILVYLLYQAHFGELGLVPARLLGGEHLELTLNKFNSSSNTTLLYWLYNQAIPFWVGFPLLLQQKNNRSRLFAFMLMLLSAPFPAVALAPLVAFEFFSGRRDAAETGKQAFARFCRESITLENLTGVLTCLVIALYYMSNASVGVRRIIPLNLGVLLKFGLFLATEYAVYLIFVWKTARKDPILWILFGTMLVCSFIQLGESYDFAWRTCIPSAFYVMLLITRRVLEQRGKKRWAGALLAAVLIIGCVTPAMEMLRSAENTAACYSGGTTDALVSDRIKSIFEQPDDPYYGNFIGKPDSLFASYLLKR